MSHQMDSALKVIKKSLLEKEIYTVTLNGYDFYTHPLVYSPKYFVSTELMQENFPYIKHENFLEIGCGVGVTSIFAAINYNNKVVSTDINQHAVNCLQKTIKKYSLENMIEVRKGNLFEPINYNETFNTIYFNPPFIYMPENYQCRSTLESSVCDPGYNLLEGFLKNVCSYTTKNTRILLGFGSMGDFDKFTFLINKYGYKQQVIRSKFIDVRGGITFTLHKLIPLNK